MGDIVNYSVPLKPFVIRKNAPVEIIAAAKKDNAICISYNARPTWHFEDESLNDDDKLDFTKPICIIN